MSDPSLGLIMLGLIVAAIMMGYPTAFTLMGLGMVFGYIAFWVPGGHWYDNRIFDFNNMLYGTLFMMCGAYTLAQAGHVRADFVYIYLKPRAQASLDLILYFLFFIPCMIGLIYAGAGFAADSWRIGEHSTVTAEGPPVYHFKAVIPVAGALVMLQGLGEIARCLACLHTGAWPPRLEDVEEIDVIDTQLAHSAYVDEESRRAAVEGAHAIEEAARHRSTVEDDRRPP